MKNVDIVNQLLNTEPNSEKDDLLRRSAYEILTLRMLPQAVISVLRPAGLGS